MRFICPDCGVTSPEYTSRAAGAVVGHIRAAHRCDQVCRHCGYRRALEGCRGLCATCHADPEVRIDYEARIWRADDLLDTWDELRREGYTVRQAAERIGVTWKALDKAIYRASKKGDPRAVRPWSKYTSRRYLEASA